ncbi:TlpA disulfide reductase family protein [Bacillus marinisedimentorum]|uniref:TlpA disulfide reductase family protein n=1 Tax=Bacillus marinisedimentorum TaxID=1821260 RepID=UPI0007E285EE|nr:TlpA disulfide reductase family protein [Bacillus marinisedimentorum]
MKKWIAILLIAGLIGYGLYDVILNDSDATDSSEEGTIGLEKGNIAPDFELTTLEGEQVRLSDYRGQKVIINFWATWCPPCRAEMPDMQSFYEKSGDKVEILAVNATMSEKKEENVAEFVENFGLTFPILMDTENNVNRKYSIVSIPTSYFVDSNGKVFTKFTGAMSYDYMKTTINKMD